MPGARHDERTPDDGTRARSPGELANWPKLQMVYRSDPDRIADLLPPGITPGKSANVYINIYCVPVLGEPEYGVSTKVRAIYDGIAGLYCLGMGIDQEAAVFISQELNGQPKFPCSIKFFRLGDQVEAVCTHRATRSSSSGDSRPASSTCRRTLTKRTSGGSSLARRWRRREELRLPAACRKSQDDEPGPTRRRPRRRHHLARQPVGPVHRPVADARAGLHQPHDDRAGRADRSLSPARSIPSRSGPTPTPSAARAGPANGRSASAPLRPGVQAPGVAGRMLEEPVRDARHVILEVARGGDVEHAGRSSLRFSKSWVVLPGTRTNEPVGASIQRGGRRRSSCPRRRRTRRPRGAGGRRAPWCAARATTPRSSTGRRSRCRRP